MRNGIYRVWYKGSSGMSAGALAFRDGEVLGSDAAFGAVGRYNIQLGRLQGEVLFARLRRNATVVGLPDLDRFHLVLTGTPNGDIASLRGMVPELPDYYLLCELARVGDL